MNQLPTSFKSKADPPDESSSDCEDVQQAKCPIKIVTAQAGSDSFSSKDFNSSVVLGSNGEPLTPLSKWFKKTHGGQLPA